MFTEPMVGEARSVWSHTEAGRGKRLFEVGVGCYVMEHISTGNLYVGHSKTVSKDVDVLIKKLSSDNHPNKSFNALAKHDKDVKLYEYPTKGVVAAKRMVVEITESVRPIYLLK